MRFGKNWKLYAVMALLVFAFVGNAANPDPAPVGSSIKLSSGEISEDYNEFNHYCSEFLNEKPTPQVEYYEEVGELTTEVSEENTEEGGSPLSSEEMIQMFNANGHQTNSKCPG